MILESRTFSPPALAAYSDFMASLDRATQTRNSSLCTTQFYKNIHISLGSITSSQFVLTPRPPDTNPPFLSPPSREPLFQTIRGRNFPTFKQSYQQVGKTPPSRKYCTSIGTRIGKGKSKTAAPIHAHFSHYHSRDDAIVRIARAVV